MSIADDFRQTFLSRSPQHTVRLALSKKMDWPAWRSVMKEHLIDSMGRGALATPLDVEYKRIMEIDGCPLIKMQYTSEPGLRTPAYILLPKGYASGDPAVIAIHGHGYGVRDILGLDPAGKLRSGDAGYQKNFGLELARCGFAVIAPELFGFGDLRLQQDIDSGDPHRSSCTPLSMMLSSYGRTMAGVRAYQCERAFQAAEAAQLIRGGRVGCMGISGGGLVAMLLSALDERLEAVVISGYGCSFADSIFAVDHCVDNYLPGLSRYAEMQDVMALIAPTPMLWESGSEDPIFPQWAAIKSADILRRVYAAQGAPDDFVHDTFEGEHEISGRMAYDFLAERLKK